MRVRQDCHHAIGFKVVQSGRRSAHCRTVRLNSKDAGYFVQHGRNESDLHATLVQAIINDEEKAMLLGDHYILLLVVQNLTIVGILHFHNVAWSTFVWDRRFRSNTKHRNSKSNEDI